MSNKKQLKDKNYNQLEDNEPEASEPILNLSLKKKYNKKQPDEKVLKKRKIRTEIRSIKDEMLKERAALKEKREKIKELKLQIEKNLISEEEKIKRIERAAKIKEAKNKK